jgi:acyl carrier protein
MTDKELYVAISPLAEQVLQIERFDSSISMMSTPSWDSLTHIRLLSGVERQFGIEIDGDDAFRLTSAEKLVQYLHSKLNQQEKAE